MLDTNRVHTSWAQRYYCTTIRIVRIGRRNPFRRGSTAVGWKTSRASFRSDALSFAPTDDERRVTRKRRSRFRFVL